MQIETKKKKKERKAGVAILISNKMDFKTKVIKKDKQGHYIILKGSIQQMDITLINILAPNIGGVPEYIKKILVYFKEEIDNNIVIIRDFNTPLSPLERLFRPKKKNQQGNIDLKQHTRSNGFNLN